MVVVKYFFEEPAAVEVTSPTGDSVPSVPGGTASTEEAADAIARLFAGPRFYRGYLSATDLAAGRSGATAVEDAQAWIRPLLELLGGSPLWIPGDGRAIADPASALQAATAPVLFAGLDRPEDGLMARAAAVPEDRRALLDLALRGIVLRPEAAFDGRDWSLWSGHPLADGMRRAFAGAPARDVRRFVIPLREARGEHRFHFERYDLGLYARHEVAVPRT